MHICIVVLALLVAAAVAQEHASRWPVLPAVYAALTEPPLRNATVGELVHWYRYTNGTSLFYCLEKCCWRYEATRWPYRGLLPGNVTKADLISPINNRGLGDVVFHKSLPLPRTDLPLFRPEFVDCIQPTTIIWVDTPELGSFFDTVLPQLHVPIILASGDSDLTAPKSYLTHLNSRKLLHWLAMNCDLPAATTAKLSCLPLGVSQWLFQDNPAFPFLDVMERVLGRGAGLQQGVLPSPRHPKSKLLLVAFSVRSNVAQRQAAWQYACEGPLKGVATCASGWSLEETYEQTAQHAFVLAPEGSGPDTYRAWETLYLGSYPVVVSNSLDSEYVGLPVLVVESIHELTEERLWRAYHTFRQRQWNYERLYLGYYHEALGQFRSGFNKEYRITYHARSGS